MPRLEGESFDSGTDQGMWRAYLDKARGPYRAPAKAPKQSFNWPGLALWPMDKLFGSYRNNYQGIFSNKKKLKARR